MHIRKRHSESIAGHLHMKNQESKKMICKAQFISDTCHWELTMDLIPACSACLADASSYPLPGCPS